MHHHRVTTTKTRSVFYEKKTTDVSPVLGMKKKITKEALAIRRIFSIVNMITKAKFSTSPYDVKIRLLG